MRKTLAFLGLASILYGMVSCGGGSGGDITPYYSENLNSSVAKVAFYITDNLRKDYSELWVTIKSITIEDSQGNVYEIFNDPNGRVVNVFALSNIAELVNIAELKPGTYTRITVETTPDVTLTDINGNTVQATLSTTTFSIDGNITISGGKLQDIVIDFDLSRSTFQNGVVDLALDLTPEQPVQTYTAKLEGVVQAVYQDSIVILLDDTNTETTITLSSDVLVFIENQGLASLQDINTGYKVYISGILDKNTGTITATSIIVDTQDNIQVTPDNNTRNNQDQNTTGAPQKFVELEGYIVRVDGTTITIDIKEAEHFVPNENTITIDISKAIFKEGDITTISPGAKIEIYGFMNLETGEVYAKVVKLEEEYEDMNNMENRNGNNNMNERGNINSYGNANINENANKNENNNKNMNTNENKNMNYNGNANYDEEENREDNTRVLNENVNENSNENYNANENMNI